MVIVSKFSNFPDELSESDELREFKLSGSDCIEQGRLLRPGDIIHLKRPPRPFETGLNGITFPYTDPSTQKIVGIVSRRGTCDMYIKLFYLVTTFTFNS